VALALEPGLRALELGHLGIGELQRPRNLPAHD